jgi:hypothetical protein
MNGMTIAQLLQSLHSKGMQVQQTLEKTGVRLQDGDLQKEEEMLTA